MNKTIVAELNNVASKLKGKSDISHNIYRLAQELETQENMYNDMSEFDPSQEQQVNTMLGHPEENKIAPMVDNDAEIKEPDATIPIESFIKPGQPEMPSPDYNVNHCSVTFYAPKDVKKSDMMNHIMGIGEKLGVEVKKFEWEEEDVKPKSSK